jgi:hypothetical protein
MINQWRYCPVCGKIKGGNTNHRECSKVLLKQSQQHNQAETTETGKNALNTEALERFKSSGQG